MNQRAEQGRFCLYCIKDGLNFNSSRKENSRGDLVFVDNRYMKFY